MFFRSVGLASHFSRPTTHLTIFGYPLRVALQVGALSCANLRGREAARLSRSFSPCMKLKVLQRKVTTYGCGNAFQATSFFPVALITGEFRLISHKMDLFRAFPLGKLRTHYLLSFLSIPGRPKPNLHWLVNGRPLQPQTGSSGATSQNSPSRHRVLGTSTDEESAVVTASLDVGPVHRRDVDSTFTCLASNTNMTQASRATVVLQMNRECFGIDPISPLAISSHPQSSFFYLQRKTRLDNDITWKRKSPILFSCGLFPYLLIFLLFLLLLLLLLLLRIRISFYVASESMSLALLFLPAIVRQRDRKHLFTAISGDLSTDHIKLWPLPRKLELLTKVNFSYTGETNQ